MRLSVRVKTSAHRDNLWREGEGLYVEVRGQHGDDDYLLAFLAGSLRVASSSVKLVRGEGGQRKHVQVSAARADLQPILDSLPPMKPAQLFED
jgi:uncharacterized protein YggU (UPF0235/DUF167 family)